MAKPPGLSFENPLYQDAGGVPSAVVNPFGFQNAAASSGSDALRDDLSSLAVMGGLGVQLARQNQFTMPEMKQPPSIGYSPSRKEFFVQGTTFAADDAQALLQAEGLLSGPGTGLPTEGDWVPLDTQSYGQLVQNVRQPTLGALAARNFGRGVDVTQMLAGRGLQLAGAEELGGRVVAQQMEDLRKTAPYERQFTDIESGRGAVEWLAANFAQQGPNLIESIATAGLGFLGGTAASGTPVGGAAAAFSSLLGKATWKEGVKAALAKKARGEALNDKQQKLLREAAGIGGAIAASYAQNVATGAADIYGELREQGAGAEDNNARLTALAGSIPYAVMETLPEFLLTARVLRGVGAPPPMGVGSTVTKAIPGGTQTITTAPRRGVELLRRGAVGGTVGGLAEGTTETGQEALLLGLSDQDFGSPENVNRLINSFAAGFGVGGPVGALANISRTPIIKDPANLLNSAQSAELTPGTGLVPAQPTPSAPTAAEPYYAPATFAGVMPAPPAQLAGPDNVPQLPGPVQPVTPMGGPVMMVTPEGVAYPDQMLRQQGNVPPGAPGTQGVLDIFGGQISTQELAARMQPQVAPLALPAPVAAPTVSPQQGALQFAPPAPPAGPTNLQMANQLQAVQDRLRRQREFEAAQAQQQAAVQQQMDMLAQQSQNARDLFILQQAQQAATQPTMPMRETGPVAPRQLELFTRKQAPRPSRAEALRRGVPGAQLPPVVGETPMTPAERRAQLSLFTREGKPTVAALKAAGVKGKVPPPKLEAGAVQAPPTGRRVTPATIAKAKAEQAAKAAPTRGLKKQAGIAKENKVVDKQGNPLVVYHTTSAEQPFSEFRTVHPVFGLTGVWFSTSPEYGKRMLGAGKQYRATLDIRNPLDLRGMGEQFDGKYLKKKLADLGIEYDTGLPDDYFGPAYDIPKDSELLQTLLDAGVDGVAVTEDVGTSWIALKPEQITILPDVVKEEKPSAAQEGKLKQGRVEQRAQDNEGVRAGRDVGQQPKAQVPASGTKAGGRGVALKRGAQQEVEAAREKRVNALVKKGQLAQAGRQWAQYADPNTQPKWDELTAEQKEAWRKIAIEDGRPSIAAAEEIAPAKKPEAAPAAPAAPAKVEALPPAEAWEDMRPEGAQTFENLPPAVRTQWAKDVAAGTATMQRARDILGDVEETPLQLVNSEFAAAEEATDIRDFRDAISTVVEYAYFTSEETNTKAAVMRARELLANTSFTTEQQNAIDSAVLNAVNTLPAVEAVYTRGAAKGDPKPWFDYATQRGLLPQITTRITGLPLDAAEQFLTSNQLRAANLPEDTVRKLKARTPGLTTGSPTADLKNDTRSNPATQLSNEIKRINTHTGVPFNPTARKRATEKLMDLWAAVQAAGMENFIDQNGDVLSSYFDEDGNPYVGVVGGQFRVATEEITTEVRSTRERIIKESQMAEDDDYEAPFTLDDWNIGKADDDYGDGRYFRDDGTQINNPIPMGRVKMLVNGFLSKLGVKPKVFIYRDQADFKAKNPSLYAKAVASRPQGDFDTASAVGYSFGDGNVVIFAQRVATEQQLKFVLAHETLGHFGFRGLLTERQLGAALDAVYNSSAKVKAAVDTAMQARKMSRREATEEYLADFAGMLDTNIIARFWNAIKNALNKLGIRFDDDMARYLVSQSRRYVRNGAPSSSFVDFKAIAQRIGAIEGMNDPDGSGRFALAGEYYDEVNRVAASNAFGQRSFKLFDLTSLFQNLQDRGINLKDYGNRLIGELKSMNYAARENQGYRRLYDIFRDTSKAAAQLRAQYNKMMDTVLSPAVELPGIGKVGKGATEEQIARTSAMLNVTSRVKLGDLTEAELRKLGSLIDIVDGEVRLNQTVFDALSARGKFTLDDFKKGIKYTVSVPRPMTDAQRTKLRAERDQELAAATSDKERKAIEAEYQKRIDEPSYLEEVEQSFDPMPDLTEQSLEWVMYNEVRDTMNQSAIDMLLANFAAAKGERDNVKRIVQRFLGRALAENDVAFLKKVEDKYLSLRAEGSSIDASGVLLTKKESVDRANDFIKKFNAAVLGKSTDRNADVQAFFDKAEADDVFNSIEGLKKDSTISRTGDDRFAMQQAIQNLALFELSKTDAELHAKRSIAGGYVPFGREGAWQVRIQAVDPTTGRVFKISDRYRQQLLYAQVENRAEAEAMSARVQGLLDEVEGGFEMEVLDGAEYVIKKVKLVAQPETARETVSTTAEANLNEIISAITRFSISVTPEERERLIVGLTQQNAKARSRLKRAGTPGEDPNTIKYVSQHLESTASTVARKQNRHRLDRLFDDADPDSIRLWFGDKVEYDRRKAVWESAQNDPNMPDAQRRAAKRGFDDYHYTFVIKESPVMGNRFKDRGRRAVAFMESQSNVDYTDFASGEVASLIRTATTFGFMGASFATAILNYLSLATNVLPAFSGYNDKNAFGGGFGWSMSSVEVSRAIGATKGFGQSEIKFWDDLLADPAKLKASGFTETEARFMQKEVGGGTMQAALTNSLLGSARGKFRSGATKTAAETWMSLFNYTEQHSRRATGLAAFRMAYAQALQQGKDAATAFEVADKFAVDMIDNTLGEYAMFNRPAMFRGDVRQFLFMFKMFPVNSIQMLAALPRKEQLLALGILAMFTGLKGLPFAENLMDIIDTIAQGLGLGPSALWKGSAERTLAEALDAIAPGMTPVLMRGLLNTITPANWADRVSLSNIVPGTGIGLAGADVGRELIEIAGPVASFLQGAVVMAGDLVKWGVAQPLGISADTTSLNSIMRESPVAFLRILGDMHAYNNAGAIVSQKGYVVSEDLHLGTMLTRALGFYPAAAVAENDVVRVAKRVTDYQKDISATYRGMYISAKIAKDNERAQEVVRMVRDWNDAAKGSGLELRNFEASANRALREAQRPATERFLRTQPIAARSATEDLLRLYGVGEE